MKFWLYCSFCYQYVCLKSSFLEFSSCLLLTLCFHKKTKIQRVQGVGETFTSSHLHFFPTSYLINYCTNTSVPEDFVVDVLSCVTDLLPLLNCFITLFSLYYLGWYQNISELRYTKIEWCLTQSLKIVDDNKGERVIN